MITASTTKSESTKPSQTGAKTPVHFTAHLRRKIAVVSRWLHVYLSMVSFAIVLFFSVTGLTLNHTEWFANSEKTIRTTGQMPHAWLRPDGNSEPSKLEIVEHLRSVNKLHGAVSDFRTEDNQISVSFKAPGYSADAFIDRDSNRYDVIEVRNGFIAVINDLHKGRDSGKVWGWLIDASAILLTLVSLTGLLLLFFVYKRRTSGLVLAGAGTIVCYLIYLRFVP